MSDFLTNTINIIKSNTNGVNLLLVGNTVFNDKTKYGFTKNKDLADIKLFLNNNTYNRVICITRITSDFTILMEEYPHQTTCKLYMCTIYYISLWSLPTSYMLDIMYTIYYIYLSL